MNCFTHLTDVPWELHHSLNGFLDNLIRKKLSYKIQHTRTTQKRNHPEVCSNDVVLWLPVNLMASSQQHEPYGEGGQISPYLPWWLGPRSCCWLSGEPGHPHCPCFWVSVKEELLSRNLSLKTGDLYLFLALNTHRCSLKLFGFAHRHCNLSLYFGGSWCGHRNILDFLWEWHVHL